MEWTRRLALPSKLWQEGNPIPDMVMEAEAPDGALYVAKVGEGGQGSPFHLVVFFDPREAPEGADPTDSRFPTPEECMAAADAVLPPGAILQSVDGIRVTEPGTRDPFLGPCMCRFVQVGVEAGSPAAQRSFIVTPDKVAPHERAH